MSHPSPAVEPPPNAPRAAQRARIADLYPQLAAQLQRILATNLNAPDWLYEEACQTAWESLLRHSDQVRPGSELSWLSTTATRCALRALRRERTTSRPASDIDHIAAGHAKLAAATPCPDTEHACELHERLAEIRHLPLRERRIVLLRGLGYEHGEIASVTGDTPRTVARQLHRARQRLADQAEQEVRA